MLGVVCPWALASSIWLRRTVKPSGDRRPASIVVRSSSVSSRTKSGACIILHSTTCPRISFWFALGTCGGSQHALIEYARNVLGLVEADHPESNPTSELPLIAPLSCPLVEVQGRIKLIPGTRMAQLYGKD